MYESLSTVELQNILKSKHEEVYRLENLRDKIRNQMDDVRDEIYRRDEWSTNNITGCMLNQLEERKNEISADAYFVIKNEIQTTLDPVTKNSKINNPYRKYSYNGLISNMYFDFKMLVNPQLKRVIREPHNWKNYIVILSFNHGKKSIETDIRSSIFSTGTPSDIDFRIDKSDIKDLSKMFSKEFKIKVNDYKEIIPSLIEAVKSLEDGMLNAAILGHYLTSV